MPKKKIAVLQNDEEWNQYLLEAFEDTPSAPEIAKTAEQALPLFRQGSPDVVFVNAGLLTRPLVAALQTQRVANPNFRTFQLSSHSGPSPVFPFDHAFDGIPPSLYEFHKVLIGRLPLPDPIRILIVDDEPEIGEMFRDYFEHRTQPAFIVETAPNGLEGEKAIQKSEPDVLIMDIKMPEKDGRELYRDLRAKGLTLPTVVFLDAVSSDEVLEIRKWGSPAFVEKGSHSSSMPEMAALIKKLAYFG